jgi:hypothetical protein
VHSSHPDRRRDRTRRLPLPQRLHATGENCFSELPLPKYETKFRNSTKKSFPKNWSSVCCPLRFRLWDGFSLLALNILQGRVSKYVTNGSERVILDIIRFPYVTLGSSTVHLHDSLGNRYACACSDSGFSSKIGDRAWGVYYRRAAMCCEFFWEQKSPMQRVFIKKCFLFTVGSVCSVKWFTARWQTFR